MKQTNIKFPLLLIVVVGLILVTAVLIMRDFPANFSSPPPVPSYTSPPPPSYPTYNKSVSVQHNPVKITTKFPGEIKSLKNPLGPISELEAQRIAVYFDLSATPETLTVQESVYYVWNTANASLLIGGDPPTLFYTQTPLEPLSRITIAEEELSQRGENLIQSMHLLPAGASLTLKSLDYLIYTGEHPEPATRQTATAAQIEYDLVFDGLPILSGFPDVGTFKILFDYNARVLSFSGFLFSGITAADGQLAIIPVEQAKARLVGGAGTLLSAYSREDRYELARGKYLFKVVEEQGVSLAYYHIPGNELFTPVFVFYGKAVDKTTAKEINTITLVSATP